MPVLLRFIPHDGKPCDCLLKSLSKVTGVAGVTVHGSEARMVYTGDWDGLGRIEAAAWKIRTRAALIEPAQFILEYAPDRAARPAALEEELARIPGVLRVIFEGKYAFVYGPVRDVDPRKFPEAFQRAGYRFVAIRSHRLRTLSYEPWPPNEPAGNLRGALSQVPGVLRVDLEPSDRKVTVLLMRESARDLALVAAAEEARFTLFPGKAEEEPEPVGTEGGSTDSEKK